MFGGNDCESILSEAARGEDAIRKACENAFADEQLPHHTIEIIKGQAQGIYAANDRIKAMRNKAND